MALQNGVLVHGPTSWGCAVRDEDGELHVASGRKPHLAPAARQRMPILRGPIALAEAFALLPTVRRALPQARFPFERPTVLGAIVATTVVGACPARARGCRAGTREIAAAGVASRPRGARASRARASPRTTAPSTSRSGRTRTAASRRRRSIRAAARSSSRRWSPRRSLANVVASKVPRRDARHRRGSSGTAAAIGGSVELFAWVARNPANPLARVLARPGFELQQPLLDGRAVGRAARGRERGPRRLPRARAPRDRARERVGRHEPSA